MKALEGVAAVVNRLSDSQRGEFQQVIEAMTEAETDPGRRRILEAFPDGFGPVEWLPTGSASGREENSLPQGRAAGS